MFLFLGQVLVLILGVYWVSSWLLPLYIAMYLLGVGIDFGDSYLI